VEVRLRADAARPGSSGVSPQADLHQLKSTGTSSSIPPAYEGSVAHEKSSKRLLIRWSKNRPTTARFLAVR